jgi:DNA polymerase/3'-5' exonuclease PolX
VLVSEGRLQELPGIGPGLARVIEEMHRTGRSRLLAVSGRRCRRGSWSSRGCAR